MTANKRPNGKLERTLDLKAALSIGVGTMVGAGIFVFPGIAAGDAGPAAMISFALGGLIALLVAVSTAELATAMPASGGGYYFVSRTFGPLWGVLVGIGQWIGLVFASAFYLVGFGQYIINLFEESGYPVEDPAVLFALGTALILTLINVLGTKGVGRLQNSIVLVLTILLSLLFCYGALSALGIIGTSRSLGPFAPGGVRPIFSTTALIFTSYLGFVQIAAVGGEIKKPQRNLPKALIGSVLIVMTLYIFAIFISTSVFSSEALADLGETAMVEVARKLLGKFGALVILGAGLLATLSSANASILSSSRAIYALSKDRLLPSFLNQVNERFGTPHGAILMVGGPIAGFTLLGEIEVLAEVASLLHLFIYGMICLSLIKLRRSRPVWYLPTFRAPGVPIVPGLGAIASLGLMVLMQPISLGIGAAVIGLSFLWYLSYARSKELAPPEPAHIAPELRNPRILVPLAVPDPAPIPKSILKPFQSLELLILGYKEVPEQTSPEQSREKFGEEAETALEEIAEDLSAEGITTTTELIFTPEYAKSINRYIEEHNCHAVLTVRPLSSLQRLIVPIYHQDQISKRLATVLHDLSAPYRIDIEVAVMDSEKDQTEDQHGPESLRWLISQQLELSGIPRKQINIQSSQVEDLPQAVKELTGDEDLVVLAESKAFERDRFFQNLHQRIANAVTCPLLVVLQENDTEREE